MASNLKPEIVTKLAKYTGLAESTLRKKISQNKIKNPSLTSNASAHFIARMHDKSLLQMLDDEDKNSLKGYPDPQTTHPKVKNVTSEVKNKRKPVNKKPIITYQSDDYFIKEHIKETTRAYYAKCYTCVFILTRKILENLLIEIIRKKFPSEPDLILHISANRYHDFSKILKNLYDKRAQFGIEGKSLIKRIHQVVKPFKDDANDKAHSWYHIVKLPTEVDDWQFDSIFELIMKLEKEVGLR